jgi:hypothetical protein
MPWWVGDYANMLHVLWLLTIMVSVDNCDGANNVLSRIRSDSFFPLFHCSRGYMVGLSDG